MIVQAAEEVIRNPQRILRRPDAIVEIEVRKPLPLI